MFVFGRVSKRRLATCCHELQIVAHAALSHGVMDFTIVEGHRPQEEQDRYFNEGKSKVRWPNGKHNKWPSEAVDLAPYINGAISWNKLHCCVLAGIILATAAERGIKIRWGGNWSGNPANIGNQSFNDFVHFELVRDLTASINFFENRPRSITKGGQMFTGREREIIVDELNKLINIPYLSEGMERPLFAKAIEMAETTLGSAVPSELQELMRVDEGLTIGKHVDELANRFAAYLNSKINIPWLPEEVEQKIFTALCATVAGAMKENTNLKLFLQEGGAEKALKKGKEKPKK